MGVQSILEIPLPVRTVILFFLGLLVGGQINRAIYRLAWHPRAIGPWSPPDPAAPPRHWSDRLPVFGWLGLAREQGIHGAWYWLRPLCIELFCAVGLAMFYQWHVGYGLHRWHLGTQELLIRPTDGTILAQFVSQSLLCAFMLVATFIDFDEKLIPDAVVIPGTLLALLLAVVAPTSMLPAPYFQLIPANQGAAGGPADDVEKSPTGGSSLKVSADFLKLTTPAAWWPPLHGPLGLVLGLAAFGIWSFALLLPRKLWFHRGISRGCGLLCAAIRRNPYLVSLFWMTLAGLLLIAAGWWVGGLPWQGLLSSLAGMAFGGGLVWAFRVVASRVLRQEALGFGDVTLMGMIGAFVGWQPSLLIFFLAPFAAVFVALAQWAITRNHEIAFGPYLCLATLFLLLMWTRIWLDTEAYFNLGIWMPLGLLLCLAAMAAMLKGYLWLKSWILGGEAPLAG